MFFKVIRYGYETFQNVAPILHPVVCSVMNTVQLQKKGYYKRNRVFISSCFYVETYVEYFFIIKRFYNLLYNSICGLLCLLSYCESINSHS